MRWRLLRILKHVAQTTIIKLSFYWEWDGLGMEYISAAEAAKKWEVTPRHVQRLLAEGRIPCARKYGRAWMIPAGAQKPADPRREKEPQKKSFEEDFARLMAATTVPMPGERPDSILETVGEERLRLQYEGELAYLRGHFRRVIQCYHRTAGDDAARLRACLVTIAAAISLGDYRAYTEVETYCKEYIAANGGGSGVAVAQLALATAAVSIIAPKMAPDWLKEGNFATLPAQARTDALYKRAKYFQCMGQYETMLAVAQTALTLCTPGRDINFPCIYLRVTCAVACHELGREVEAGRWLLEAMKIALPHGFITPFAEVVTALGGLVEQCLEREFPHCYDAVLDQWKRTWKNWIAFHNQFTKDNITLILSLREYHLALLVARRVPYAQIAKRHCISVGRLKNIMLEIYEKLCVSGRDELSQYVF